jgi:predicted metal-dependent phosphoesterase TrpH
MPLADAIAVIRACGGQAVLAHPTRYGLSATNIRHLVAEFAQLGGQALELPPRHEPIGTRGMIDRLVDQHALRVSCASDFHGPNMPWLKLGQTPVMSAGQRGVWEVFSPYTSSS